MDESNGLITRETLLGIAIPTRRVKLRGFDDRELLVRALPPSFVLRTQSQGEWRKFPCEECDNGEVPAGTLEETSETDPDALVECPSCEGRGEMTSLVLEPFAAEILYRGIVNDDGTPLLASVDEAKQLLETGDSGAVIQLVKDISEMSRMNTEAEADRGN